MALGSRQSSTRSGCVHCPGHRGAAAQARAPASSWRRCPVQLTRRCCLRIGVHALALARACTPCSTASLSTSSLPRLRCSARVAPSRRLASAASGHRSATRRRLLRRTVRSRSTPTWRSIPHGCTCVLAARGTCCGRLWPSLPLQSFDMEMQHERAFRMCSGAQHGQDRVAHGADSGQSLHGVHVVTGGTSWSWPAHGPMARAARRTLRVPRVAQRRAGA